MSEGAIRLSFLYDRFKSVNGVFLKFWIDNPEFQSAVLSAMNQRKVIDERFLLDTMKSIYDEKMWLIQKGEGIDFNYKLANRAIKKLGKMVEPST